MLSWLNAVRATSPRIGQRCAIKKKGKTVIMRKMTLVWPFTTSSATCTEIDWRRTRCTAENLLHAFCLFHILWWLQQQQKKTKRKMASRDKNGKANYFLQRFWGCQNQLRGTRPPLRSSEGFHLTVWTTYFKRRDHPQFSHSLLRLSCHSWMTEATGQDNASMLKHTSC